MPGLYSKEELVLRLHFEVHYITPMPSHPIDPCVAGKEACSIAGRTPPRACFALPFGTEYRARAMSVPSLQSSLRSLPLIRAGRC